MTDLFLDNSETQMNFFNDTSKIVSTGFKCEDLPGYTAIIKNVHRCLARAVPWHLLFISEKEKFFAEKLYLWNNYNCPSVMNHIIYFSENHASILMQFIFLTVLHDTYYSQYFFLKRTVHYHWISTQHSLWIEHDMP